MSVQDIIVYIIVLLCVMYTGKHFFKFFRKRRTGVKWLRLWLFGLCYVE